MEDLVECQSETSYSDVSLSRTCTGQDNGSNHALLDDETPRKLLSPSPSFVTAHLSSRPLLSRSHSCPPLPGGNKRATPVRVAVPLAIKPEAEEFVPQSSRNRLLSPTYHLSCWGCGSPNHRQSHCPTYPLRCHTCGLRGHKRSRCPALQQVSQHTSPGLSLENCMECGDLRHYQLYDFCPHRQTICYECGQLGHKRGFCWLTVCSICGEAGHAGFACRLDQKALLYAQHRCFYCTRGKLFHGEFELHGPDCVSWPYRCEM